MPVSLFTRVPSFSAGCSFLYRQALKKGTPLVKITKGMFSKKRTSVKWVRLSDDLKQVGGGTVGMV